MTAPNASEADGKPAPASTTPSTLAMAASLAEFRQRLALRRLTPDTAAHFARASATAFLSQFTASGYYLGEAITLLCELASLDDPALSQIGVHGLFPLLIEPLGDTFTAQACAVYDRLFSQVIQHCRRQPDGAAIDRQLRRFGLATETDLLARAARIRKVKRFEPELARQIQKAFVLSRVTLGADIAITSVALAALKEALPRAEIALVANAKTHQLFAGDPGVQLCTVDYPRGGGLIERLKSWQSVLEAIQQDTVGLDPSQYVIVDPDSRLTQLGLLPLVADERAYVFFESRSYSAPGLQQISALTAHWLQEVFGSAGSINPYCAPSQGDTVAAKRIVEMLKPQAMGSIVSVNLGVGANPAKRLPDPFEARLLARLLAAGATVILDKGGDPQEVARIDTLMATLGDGRFPVLALDDRDDIALPAPGRRRAAMVTWQGGIGRFAALIAESTAYIGYDSAGQHIAAALGVPTIDIFTGFTSPRMPERWSPRGRGPVQLLVLDSSKVYTPANLEAIVDSVVAHLPLET